ncbi:peroxiredoxin-like family protein [Aquimarina muelleri]|uniref:thioredoxin-dependent peroxiredoxin n=1 Tax=Aquimarina muelleri TaxID=279356 RepID=A0A918JSU6_9FLAO|nr:peroxiredoxin-like family protein [Aquimarina muelleri]MCX2764913.1 AhpC/TSA family protein [Aquimarina muelleri]GGX04615.1 peroxiredoxin [Aquimarina muelleri]
MSLTKDLKASAEASAKKHPENILQIMNNRIQDLKDKKLVSKALKTGDTIPEITLPNAVNKKVSIQELLLDKKVIVSFYRGGWCPYCNLELNALQQALPEFEKLGATLIAISPETPDNSLTTSDKNNLSFEVLSDLDNTVAKKFNLVFTLPKDLIEVYKGFNIDLEKSNGNTNQELPISATYVIDKDGTILYDFIKEDYKERADPNEIIKHLKNI